MAARSFGDPWCEIAVDRHGRPSFGLEHSYRIAVGILEPRGTADARRGDDVVRDRRRRM